MMENERDEKSVEVMYGSEDLGSSALFPEGWINFGYWKGLNPETTRVRERVEASKALYRLVHSKLALSSGDLVVEVGSGRGHGVGLLVQEKKLEDVVGVDITPEQVERANRIYAGFVSSYLANFLVGAAEELPIRSDSATRLYSVEAIQHFSSPETFCKEAFRVLTPDAKLALTSFFLTDEKWLGSVAEVIPTVKSGLDRPFAISQMKSFLERAGFVNVQIESIGAEVWPGFDHWVKFISGESSWGREWKGCADKGWMDYVVVTAEKK